MTSSVTSTVTLTNWSSDEDNVPVFFGHYWLDPTILNPPQVQTGPICCLDYSVANDGLLTAYRWEGEKTLKNDRFVWV